MEPPHLQPLRQFLHTASRPAIQPAEPTFFSIAGIERRELALSNAYAFFFRSSEVHGLGSLFTEALLDALWVEKPAGEARPAVPGVVRVAREQPVATTAENNQKKETKYLDLLLHNGQRERPISADATFAILIENKIDHWLHNDLAAYWDCVPPECDKLGVVLGVRRHPIPALLAAHWQPLTHAELARAVENRLGPAISQASPRYLPVLFHFLDHLKQMSESHQNFTLAFDFVQRHRAELAEMQRVQQLVTARGLAEAVAQAFGPEYQLRKEFDDRADIQRNDRHDFRYVVFFGHVLNLGKQPGYAITLYAGGAGPEQVAAWRRYLLAQPPAQRVGMEIFTWYDKLVVGKSYSLPTGSTLGEIQQHLKAQLADHWQPLEAAWRPHQVAPGA